MISISVEGLLFYREKAERWSEYLHWALNKDLLTLGRSEPRLRKRTARYAVSEKLSFRIE